MPLIKSGLGKFWSRVNKHGPLILDDPCWQWVAGCVRGGYGAIRLGQKFYYAHRLSWLIHFGSANGLLVCHSCDNKKCVNPSHLFLGTIKDNADDMVAKDREPYGVKNGNHHLGEEEIRLIKFLIKSGVPQKVIAAKFLTSQSHVSNIANGKRRAKG